MRDRRVSVWLCSYHSTTDAWRTENRIATGPRQTDRHLLLTLEMGTTSHEAESWVRVRLWIEQVGELIGFARVGHVCRGIHHNLKRAFQSVAMRPVVISYITPLSWHHSYDLPSPFIGIGTLPLNILLQGFCWLGWVSGVSAPVNKVLGSETNRWLQKGLSTITSLIFNGIDLFWNRFSSTRSSISLCTFYSLLVLLCSFGSEVWDSGLLQRESWSWTYILSLCFTREQAQVRDWITSLLSSSFKHRAVKEVAVAPVLINPFWLRMFHQ